jgi:protein-disulfide isomerase
MQQPRLTFDRVVNAVMACSALGMAILYFFRDPEDPPPPGGRTFTLAAAIWDSAAKGAHRLGSASAPAQLVVVADFQCPACKRFNEQVLPRIRDRFGDQLAVSFRHWPLAYHEEAVPAAIAAECAGAQGTFWPMHDTLFANQRSLGSETYAELAAEAGVADTANFSECLRSPTPATAVERDLRLAESIGGAGTPTIILNGRVLGRGSLEPELTEAIQAVITEAP